MDLLDGGLLPGDLADEPFHLPFQACYLHPQALPVGRRVGGLGAQLVYLVSGMLLLNQHASPPLPVISG